MIINRLPCVCVPGQKEKRGAQHHEYLLVLGVPRNNINKWEEEAGRILFYVYIYKGGCSSFETFCLEILSLPVVSGSSNTDQNWNGPTTKDGWSLSLVKSGLSVGYPIARHRWATTRREI